VFAVLYTWLVDTPLPALPSPKLHAWDTMRRPAAAVDAPASKKTSAPAVAGIGDTVNEATGGVPAATVNVLVASADRPNESLTVNRTRYAPAVE